MIKGTILFCVLIAIAPARGNSCGWDYDTIAMESQKMPEVRELIAGYFLRHSPEFYYWRIKDREAKIKKGEEKPEYYDDIAWAYSKIERQDDSLEWIQKKDKKWPGLYETHANWGIVLLFKDEWEEGLKHLKKAIEINPDAHFGREVFQIMLVEYIISLKKKGPLTFPLDVEMLKGWKPGSTSVFDSEYSPHRNFGFQKYFNDNKEKYAKFIKGKNPIDGFRGMMRFASFRNPVLLETLGDMLGRTSFLSSLAYLKTAKELNRSDITDLFRLKSRVRTELKDGWVDYTVSGLERELDLDVKAGNEFYEAIRKNEITWILKGENPEAKFEKKYYGKEYKITREIVVRAAEQRKSRKMMSDILSRIDKLKPVVVASKPAEPLPIDQKVKDFLDNKK